VKALISLSDIKARTLLLCCFLFLAGGNALAADKATIDKQVASAMETFLQSPSAGQLIDRAHGVLVFPKVVEMGFGIGGQYGEGALLVDGDTEAYYASAGSSIGLQVGAQNKAQLVLFMTASGLKNFRRAKTWEAGVDGVITVARAAEDGTIDSNVERADIIGFVFSNSGFMYNLSLEGIKITGIQR